MNIAILGTGTWSLALANLSHDAKMDVTVWGIDESILSSLRETRVFANLPGLLLPERITYEKDIVKACEGSDIILVAVASKYVRETVRKLKGHLDPKQIIVSVAKGIEEHSLYTMSMIIEDELGKENKVVALSGPTHAEEVALRMPTSIVAASDDLEAASIVQHAFSTPYMRVYTNSDIKGVELCGAVKNVIALACGVSAGLGYGDNAKAALITRGIAELARLGKALGASEDTFSGLTGTGDLIVTATSRHSRNNKCGYLLGKGMNVEDAKKEVGMVVEGLYAIKPTMELADKYNVEMPIVEACNSLVYEGARPEDIVRMLFERRRKAENE